MPLRRAVKRLKLVRDDLERLADSCRRWSREPSRASLPARVVADGELEPAPSATGARPHLPDDGSAAEDAIDRTGEPNEHDPDQTAVKLLRRQARRVERLSRRVRREWQEKLLALRMEALFGRRFVAILENTVLVLILVLFGLIAAEVVLERASPDGALGPAARVLRLGRPGDLLGLPLRVRPQAGAGAAPDDLFPPPLA